MAAIDAIQASCAAMVQRVDASLGFLSRMAAALENRLAAAIPSPGLAAPGGGAAEDGLGPLAAVGVGLASLQQIIGSVKQAFFALEAPLTTLAGAMTPFVAALSPATVQVFDLALRGLHATIGTALLPAFQVLTGIVRDTAGTIDPLMKALAPVLKQITETLGSVFTSAVQTVVTLFTSLTPVLDVLAAVLEVGAAQFKVAMEVLQISMAPMTLVFTALGAVLKPVMEVFTWIGSTLGDAFKAVQVVIQAVTMTLMQFIGSLLGGLSLKDTLHKLTEIVQKVIVGFVLLTAYVAALIGQKGYIDNLLAATAAKGQGEAPAAQGAGIKSLEDITKSIDTAAFGAGQGQTVSPEADLLAKIHAELLKMGKGPDLRAMVHDVIAEVWTDVEVKAASWVAQILAKLPRLHWESR